jgi:hypothetical protein
MGASAMGLFVLDAVLWIFGIRGHIPQSDGFPNGHDGSSVAANGGALLRGLAAVILSVGLLSLALWAAVWLTIKLL